MRRIVCEKNRENEKKMGCRICGKTTLTGRTVYPFFVRMCQTHSKQEADEYVRKIQAK